MQKQLAWQNTRVHHLDLHVKDAASSAGFYCDLRREHEAKRTLYLGRALPPAAAQAKSLTKSPSAPTTRASAAWPRVISDYMISYVWGMQVELELDPQDCGRCLPVWRGAGAFETWDLQSVVRIRRDSMTLEKFKEFCAHVQLRVARALLLVLFSS
jgi:hypothetical protein